MVTIPGYEIENLIYKGKVYAIYRGVRQKDDQPVILKRSRIETSQPNLYENEYAILRSLTGEGIVRVLDLVDQQDKSVLIYEDIGADSLDNLLEKSNFSLTERLSIATGITAALVRVHHDGFIHKCINPSNILYCPDTGRIQLINFEFATELIAGELYSDGSEVTQKTMAYIAPEQTGKMNRPLDYRSDLYSLGATLYELFSGKPIFQTLDILEFVHSHIAVIPLPPHAVDSMIPPTLANIIMKLLAKEAEDRYLCAAGLKYDLDVCIEQYKKTNRIDSFILQERDISDQFRISSRLYGRTEEINVVKTALKRSQAGSMELVLVTGYAGIGKTAMVREALQQITTDHTEVAVHLGIGRFDRFHRDTPYSAITKAARDVVRQILAQTDEAVKNWRKKLTEALGRNGRVIADIIPEIEIIIGSQPEVPLLGPLEAQNRFNLVFQNFVRALSGPDHPLLIFLDDIQYADAASSKLIETILTDDGLHHFLGIATYRDDETDSDNPIHATLDALKLQNVRLTWLQMESLGFESVKSLIADSFHTDKVRVSGLSELTLQKTDGNPFFIGLFLKTLRSENLLTFDSGRGQWQWSISRINKLESTDNVVDLLVQKIKRLSENTQEILGWASCIGIEFDLSAFIAISGIDATEIGSFFREAIQEGLLLVVEPFYQQTRGNVPSPKEVQGSYRFTHDRIRQAVYSSIDAIHKQHCHAQIGLYLLQNLSDTEQPKELFSIVNHLNAGNEKTVTVVNREKLARLNIDAGLKAKSAAAFSPAFKYFQNGMQIIGRNCWEDNYQLTKDLYEKAAETAYLCGYYRDMERLAKELLQHANSLLDTVNVHETVINSYIARYQLEKAITTALDMLLKLDVNLPNKTSKWILFKGFIGAKSTLAWKDIENLSEIKKMTDPTVLAAMQIFGSVGAATYFSNQELMAIMTFKAVQLSIKHGNAPESVILYSAYGLILCSVVGDIDSGFRFGQLALRLLDKFNLPELASQAGHLVNAFINHWKIHLRETLSPLKQAYLIGLETGNFEYAGYGALFFCYHSLFAGIELPEVERRIGNYSRAISRLKHEFSQTFLQIFHQTVVNLKDKVNDPCRLSGTYYDESHRLSKHREAKDKTTLANVFFIKLYLNYLFGEYSNAREYVSCMEEYIDGLNGTITIPLFYFYNSLTQLALYANAEAPEQRQIFKRVAGNQKKMKHWAKHAPMNYQHKYLLVEAERLSVIGQRKQAEKHYQQAAELAKQHGYCNEEALILERTAIFYASIEENQLAADTIQKARTTYGKWGALAKVKALDKEFAHLLIDGHIHIGKNIEFSADILDQEHQLREKDLDLAAVMKATQAISSEIVLEKLMAQLMRIIIENAGAQTGLLILKKEEGLRVEATARADSDDVDANQSLPVEESNALSLDIVRYVDRTGEPVVIHKATEDSQFYTDPHILERRPKSILCMPIFLKDKITGVLYLENNLANNVFTRERIEILNILLAQAAISLENALLYENLKKEVTVRKQAEERLLHLATALEQAAEAILITDMDGTITYANPVCEEIFGYNQEEIIGKNTRIFRSGQQGQGFFEDIWKIISCGKIWSGRMSSKKKDDSIRELEVTASPIKDVQGKIISFVSVSRDVTHEIEMEKELRQAQKMEAMGTLAGGIAHDFNNILTAIMGYTELATSQSHPESPIHQNLEQVIASAKRAKDLVRQILAFSRKTDQEARPVQLQIIVKEALKMLRASLPATIEIQVDIEDVSGYVEADPTQIQQVVVNLCTNSAQSMESGGVLMVRLEDYIVAGKNHHFYPEVIPGQYLRFIVRDNGEGIDRKIIERIFEPFFTTKEPGKGTGMGLAMVHGIVKRCKGAIRVASEPGQGTEFCVLFPIYEGKLPEEEKPSSVNASPGLERIMFVDDEKTLVTLMEDGLQRIGYQMHTETDSNTALKVFKQDPDKFDLVITDRTMPKLTGIELSKALIQIRPDIPIILYSGLMEELSPEMLQAAGIRCSLSKPLMLKQLAEAIRQVLDNKEVAVAE